MKGLAHVLRFGLQGVLPEDELMALMASQHRPNYVLGVRVTATLSGRGHTLA